MALTRERKTRTLSEDEEEEGSEDLCGKTLARYPVRTEEAVIGGGGRGGYVKVEEEDDDGGWF